MAVGLAVPLTNPSFETCDLSGWTIESGSWSVDTDIAAGITEAADGSYFAYQSGLGSGAISQVVNVSDYHLESGDVITLRAFAADWTSSSDTADLTIEAFDAGGAPVSSATTSTDLAAEDVWEQVSVELTLTGTPATIKLTLDELEDFGLDPLDHDETMSLVGVIGMGIKSVVLYHLNPQRLPARGRNALYALYFLSDRDDFGLPSRSSEFLMINDGNPTSDVAW